MPPVEPPERNSGTTDPSWGGGRPGHRTLPFQFSHRSEPGTQEGREEEQGPVAIQINPLPLFFVSQYFFSFVADMQNERLFREMYKAYKEGRADKDPSEFWYEGEIGFFDFYIIPLAKKLKDCGVFGKSSDEYLNYALNNREEWKARGRDVVNEMMNSVAAQDADPTRVK